LSFQDHSTSTVDRDQVVVNNEVSGQTSVEDYERFAPDSATDWSSYSKFKDESKTTAISSGVRHTIFDDF